MWENNVLVTFPICVRFWRDHTRPVPIESSHSQLSIGVGLVNNGSVLRKLWSKEVLEEGGNLHNVRAWTLLRFLKISRCAHDLFAMSPFLTRPVPIENSHCKLSIGTGLGQKWTYQKNLSPANASTLMGPRTFSICVRFSRDRFGSKPCTESFRSVPVSSKPEYISNKLWHHRMIFQNPYPM